MSQQSQLGSRRQRGLLTYGPCENLSGPSYSQSTRQLISDSANVVRHTQAVECRSSTSARTSSAFRFSLDLLFMSARRRNAKGVSATARDTSPKTNGTTVSTDAGRQKDNGMSVLQLAPAVLDIYSVRDIIHRACHQLNHDA